MALEADNLSREANGIRILENPPLGPALHAFSTPNRLAVALVHLLCCRCDSRQACCPIYLTVSRCCDHIIHHTVHSSKQEERRPFDAYPLLDEAETPLAEDASDEIVRLHVRLRDRDGRLAVSRVQVVPVPLLLFRYKEETVVTRSL